MFAYSHKTYQIRSNYPLDYNHIKILINFFQKDTYPSKGRLNGRCALFKTSLPDIGSIMIKKYTRGGVLRHFIKQYYIRLFREYRCQSEFKYLNLVNSLGVNVPRPIIYAYQGHFVYQAWLITLEIKDSLTLADLRQEERQDFKEVVKDLAKKVSILIDNSIFHHDFHPGNVLIGPSGGIYFLDFDKASLYKGDKQRLKRKYLRRWEKAINKHELANYLNTSFKKALNYIEL